MRTPFSLEFRTDTQVASPQGIYRVEHDGADPLDIFLVSIGPGRLEAIFG